MDIFIPKNITKHGGDNSNNDDIQCLSNTKCGINTLYL